MTGKSVSFDLLYNNRETWSHTESGLYDDIRGITHERTVPPTESRETVIDYQLTQNPDIIPEQVEVKYTSLDPDIIAIDENGVMTGVEKGFGTVKVSLTLNGYTRELEKQVVVGSTKTRRSFYSDDEIAAAYENMEKYPWAASTRDSAVNYVKKYIGQEEFLWNWVTPTTLPHCWTVGYLYDPMAPFCAYCETDLRLNYGTYPWLTDALKRPWKVQCPACRRVFPSNDFGKYYSAGLDEHGIFQPELAKQYGSEFLTNDLYPEKGQSFRIPLANVKDASPVFFPIGESSAAAGRKISYTVYAESPLGMDLTSSAVTLPRGANISETGVFTWTPDSNQIGRISRTTLQMQSAVW